MSVRTAPSADLAADLAVDRAADPAVDPPSAGFSIEDISDALAPMAATVRRDCESCRACGVWKLKTMPSVSGVSDA
jgi:hypothetical protein